MTDAEMAAALRLSVWTVKKRWQGIYARVEAATPEMLAAPALPAASEGEDLAASSRRLLLNYLRVHPEELAPGAA